MTISSWGKAAATPVILLHTCFSLGTSLAPLITAPFLSATDSNHTAVPDTPHNHHDDASLQAQGDNNSSSDVTSTHIRIPYGLFGLWSVAFGIIFFVFFWQGSYYTAVKSKKKMSLKTMLNPGTCANGKVCFGLYFVVSLLFLYIFVNGRDRALPSFLFAIANKGMGMSKTVSALLLTTYNLVAAGSRGLCAVVSKYVRIQIVLFVEVMAGLLLQMYLTFYGLHSDAALWTLSCSLVFFTAPTYPTAMAWADRYIEVTGSVVAMIDIGIGLGGFTALFITGNLFQNHGSQAVLKFGLALAVLVTAVYLPLQLISWRNGDRHANKQELEDTVSVHDSLDDLRDEAVSSPAEFTDEKLTLLNDD